MCYVYCPAAFVEILIDVLNDFLDARACVFVLLGTSFCIEHEKKYAFIYLSSIIKHTG